MEDKDVKSEASRRAGENSVTGSAGEAACRCKETAVMTPRQLLGLMMHDLAFWKKRKKDQHG